MLTVRRLALRIVRQTNRVADGELLGNAAGEDPGASAGRARNVPRNRTVTSCTAKPTRL
jgi:hypothetical protein